MGGGLKCKYNKQNHQTNKRISKQSNKHLREHGKQIWKWRWSNSKINISNQNGKWGVWNMEYGTRYKTVAWCGCGEERTQHLDLWFCKSIGDTHRHICKMVKWERELERERARESGRKREKIFIFVNFRNFSGHGGLNFLFTAITAFQGSGCLSGGLQGVKVRCYVV